MMSDADLPRAADVRTPFQKFQDLTCRILTTPKPDQSASRKKRKR
jgi:hypothetical protein